MNIAIVGFGAEGQAAHEYLSAQGHTITICDLSADIEAPAGVATQLGPDYLDNLDRFDSIVRSAGIAPHKILAVNPTVEEKIITVIGIFLRDCPTKNVIGVTGTKGKGTTSTLITKMLEADTKHVKLGGNIGLPPLSFIHELTPESWVVLELSSFQLIDLKQSPHIAVCLMVVSEHMDWHADLLEYYDAKSQLFKFQTADDIAIFNPNYESSTAIAGASVGTKIPYLQAPGAQVIDTSIVIADQTVCQTSEIKLLGAHNWQNVCAAITAVWQVTQNIDAIRSVLTTFTGLEHRLEFVRERDGIKYYDDSFGTTPETAIVAMQAFSEPKVVILGGSDKGASYDDMAAAVKNSNVRHVVLIGQQADRIQAALERVGYQDFSAGGSAMEDIVHEANNNAEAGDIVLLSTGCASFGLFKNYKDRGNQFKATVSGL